MNVRFTAFLGILCLFLHGCGVDPLAVNRVIDDTFGKVVKLATSAQIRNTIVVENSYIVVFRSND